jgi:putative tricarboxylic transport membrane protein
VTTPSQPLAEAGFADVAAGILFLALGGAALWIGGGYEAGNATDMGPGYFPRLIGWALVAFGMATILRGIVVGGWARPYLALRPLLVLSLAFIVFGLAIDRLGLFLAGALTVLVASFAQQQPRWRGVAATALGLGAFCAILFGYALNLSLPVWPR